MDERMGQSGIGMDDTLATTYRIEVNVRCKIVDEYIHNGQP